MSSNWPLTKLRDFIDFQNGQAIKTESLTESGKNFIFGSNGIIGRTDKSNRTVPVSIIGRVGAYCGSIHCSDGPAWVTDNAITAGSKESSHATFVFYLLKTLRLERTAIGSAQPLLTQGGLKNIEVLLPPLPVQNTIAHILSSLDDKIELNRRMNRTLEQMARALFQSWFVDFDPVRAKMRGEVPEGMDAETAALFPDALEEVEGREIPVGWRVGTVSDIAFINNSVLKKDDLLQTIRYIEISAALRGDISEIVEYQRGLEPSRARRRLRHGDTVMSTVRPDREAYFLSLFPEENLIVSTGFAVISSREAEHWPLIFSFLTRVEIFKALGTAADGGAYPAINPDVISNLQIVLPDDSKIISSFCVQVTHLLTQTHILRTESAQLERMRDELLPRLLSGELDVSGWAEETNLACAVSDV